MQQNELEGGHDPIDLVFDTCDVLIQVSLLN